MNMNDIMNKVILTDVDGVLLNWEYAFNTWMSQRGYSLSDEVDNSNYDMDLRYGIAKSEFRKLIKFFNESAAIGFLPPLRDAMYYVDLLHRKHGYTFHAITSLSTDENAVTLREQNIRKLFGETAFTKIVCIGTGADKDDVLEPYRGSELHWIEDKVENAELGVRLGLDSILVEHRHNMHHATIPKMKNWKEIYEYIVG
jgi:hypothetical protein